MQSADAEKRSRLISLKLRALLRDHLGTDDIGEPVVFPLGAGFVGPSAVWLFVDGDAARALGPSLAVALRLVDSDSMINVLAERDTGLLARRAAYFSRDIRVWHVDGRALLPAIAEPFPPSVAPSSSHLRFADLIESSGATVVIEHGVVSGEVDGLEICRVVTDDVTKETRLEVGVGAHDREAFALLHGHVPTEHALRQVVEAVSSHRREGADPHPLNALGAERLLRVRATARPDTIGMAMVSNAEPPVRRPNVKDATPCVATAVSADGDDVVVTFVHGVDLDAVSYAIDAQQFLNPHARVVLAMRGRDMTPSITKQMSLGIVPVEFAAIAS